MHFIHRWIIVLMTVVMLTLTLNLDKIRPQHYNHRGFIKDHQRILANVEAYSGIETDNTSPKQFDGYDQAITNTINNVTQFKYRLTVPPCDEQRNLRKSLFVVVLSSAENEESRMMIRRSWGRFMLHDESEPVIVAGFAFFLSPNHDPRTQEEVDLEQKEFKDLIQLDEEESDDEVIKLAALLNWIDKECSGVGKILLVKDDVYVNVRNLGNLLVSRSFIHKEGIFGTVNPNLLLQRRNDSIDYISNDTWPLATFPAHLHGGSLLISNTLVRRLLSGFQTTPFLPLSDVYLTGLVAEKTGIRIYKNNGMFDINPKFPLDPCYVRHVISWKLNTTDEWLKSHVAIKEFYNKEKKCYVPELAVKATKIREEYSRTSMNYLNLQNINATVNSEEVPNLVEGYPVDPLEPVAFPFTNVVHAPL